MSNYPEADSRGRIKIKVDSDYLIIQQNLS